MLPTNIQNLIQEFSKLPGIGPKSAERLVFYLLKTKQESLEEFSGSVKNLKKYIKNCSVCNNFTEKDPCLICSDKNRDGSVICVVSEPLDVVALEKTNEFKGVYHVLQGVISPINGVGPEDLTIDQLISRIKKGSAKEVIIATNPTTEGEATSLYILKLLQPFKIKTTRIARGLPMGSDLEYADAVTLTRALEGRKEI